MIADVHIHRGVECNASWSAQLRQITTSRAITGNGGTGLIILTEHLYAMILIVDNIHIQIGIDLDTHRLCSRG